MGKGDQERDIYEEMDNLKAVDDDYRQLVYAIETEIEKFIASKNAVKSYRPKSSERCKLNVTVKAVPITAYELEMLEEYLEEKYLDKVYGLAIFVEKCFLRKKYRIFSCLDEEEDEEENEEEE